MAGAPTAEMGQPLPACLVIHVEALDVSSVAFYDINQVVHRAILLEQQLQDNIAHRHLQHFNAWAQPSSQFSLNAISSRVRSAIGPCIRR